MAPSQRRSRSFSRVANLGSPWGCDLGDIAPADTGISRNTSERKVFGPVKLGALQRALALARELLFSRVYRSAVSSTASFLCLLAWSFSLHLAVPWRRLR